MSSSNSDKEAHRSNTHPRIVCGAVPINYLTNQILLISSRKHKGNWVLPKGGYELSDVRLETAASREAFEEAGVIGQVRNLVLSIDDKRPIKTLTDNDPFIPRARYHFFEISVDELSTQWPESNERDRCWCSFGEALNRVSWRDEQRAALLACSLNNNSSSSS
ncbi:hypothetical protein WALSEDRAFT_63135 [Wallemia mellicola CBS 633.66]|uniref:Nudix hydrolase domain-containing protein n=1 Tax=Wallemia mellicola (strain ATCC MYA-4683 / CBS 633.66) TaxID=671144 RepID=I4YGM0_WALMC|nr:hypothetical protein WALSEDRAFT_63135 [Wallemia mellicola CBS 633.66]EIM23112.1 hypothetical protein WALSEDRAFT_63135 [Wallemia mellicola CBS 633.66]|eukprot:XP_006957145.1 hypothetical protein WALSEDRAFT_63135 [Wallemia mellicola CBS 633.66]